MAVGFAHWVWQESGLIIAVLTVVAFYGYLIPESGFNVTVIAAGANTGLFLGTQRAARARHVVAMTLGLVLLIVALGVFSHGVLAHSGVHAYSVGGLTAVWLAIFLSLVQ